MTTKQKVNPQMIVLARESRGLTQRELADATSLSQANISKFESGVLEVLEENLEKLVGVLNYPRGFFFQNDPIYGYGSSCLYHRKRQTLPSTVYRTLLAKINVIRIQVTNLLQGTEISAPLTFPRMDIEEYGSGEHIARLVRGMWNLPPGPVANLVSVIEGAGGVVIRCPFGTDKLDAFSQWLPGLPPLFFLNSAIPTDRYRYTLAHEIGHLIMHYIPSPNLEKEADEFAAEFLMPQREITPQLRPVASGSVAASLESLVNLKRYWKVSIAALIRRARDLGRINDSRYRRLYMHLGRLGYRKNEPVNLPHEEPTILLSVLDVHMREHGYTIKQLSDRVQSFELEFRSNYFGQQPQSGLRVVD